MHVIFSFIRQSNIFLFFLLSFCSFVFECNDLTYKPSSIRLLIIHVFFLEKGFCISFALSLGVITPLCTPVILNKGRWNFCLAFQFDITTYYPIFFYLFFILILFLEKLVLILTGILCPCLSLSTSSAEVVPLISKSTVRLAEATETALAFNLIFEVYCIICTKCSLCYLYIQAM